MKRNSFFTTALLSSSLFLAACGGPKDVDKIADAQNCLDQAKPADVPTCVAKVDGMESESAYLIRCVGKFAKEGLNDPARLATALDNTSGNSGSSGSAAMMAALAFKTESTPGLNATSAEETKTYCGKANSKGLIFLAGLSFISTKAAALGNVDPNTLTGSQLQTLLGSLATDPTAQAAVGSAVTSIYQSNCSNNSSSAGNYCKQFESVVSSVSGGLDNPSGIGQQIMTCYSNPAAAGCSSFQ